MKATGYQIMALIFWPLAPVILLLAVIPAYMVKPKHVSVRFTRTPPVIARVNTPSENADDKQRRIRLPTGDKYLIPARTPGHFVMVFDWKVRVAIDGFEYGLVIPKLSTTDFASIPRPLHALLSPLNNTIYAAIVHDYLYRDPCDPSANGLPRSSIDRMFYWGMRARGVRRLTAGLMYLGVRVGGARSYRRTRGLNRYART